MGPVPTLSHCIVIVFSIKQLHISLDRPCTPNTELAHNRCSMNTCIKWVDTQCRGNRKEKKNIAILPLTGTHIYEISLSTLSIHTGTLSFSSEELFYVVLTIVLPSTQLYIMGIPPYNAFNLVCQLPSVDSICLACFTGKDAKRKSGCDWLMMSALGREVGHFRVGTYFWRQG